MTQLIEALIGGLVLGAVYGVISLGLSLLYGIAKAYNFAHGSFFVWGAYIVWVGLTYLTSSFWWAFAIALPLMFCFGLFLERFVVRPIRSRPGWGNAVFLATLGFSMFLNNLALVIFGSRKKAIPPFMEGTVNVGGIVISKNDILIFIIAIAVVVILELFLKRNRLGMAMRAVAQSPMGADIVGIPIHWVFSFTFGVSAVLAGVSGILLAPKYMIYPLGGNDPFLKAFVIVFFGGLGSIKGTLVAAFILGILESLVAMYVGAIWTMVIFFIVLMVVMIFRPRGLFGTWEALEE
jgi:branched-chain amino acid transport system permease protein